MIFFPEKCRIGTTPQNDWYFFSHKDKKYPTGTRTNRATVAGFWKATGRDKVIHGNGRRIGMRKTLVFYKGRAPHGQKSDWIMHEYRLDEGSNINNDTYVTSHVMSIGEFQQEEGWVVCRIFKKKNHIKTLDSSIINNTSNMTIDQSHYSTILDSPSDDNDHDDNNDQGALEQIFQTLGTPQNKNNIITRSSLFHNNLDINKFMKLPSLDESPNYTTSQLSPSYYHPMHLQNDVVLDVKVSETELGGDWATLDRLVATHLNGHTMDSMASIFSSSSSSSTTVDLHHDHDANIQLPCLRSPSSGNKNYHNAPNNNINNNNNNNTLDNYNLWSFTRSTLPIDPLCHVSEAAAIHALPPSSPYLFAGDRSFLGLSPANHPLLPFPCFALTSLLLLGSPWNGSQRDGRPSSGGWLVWWSSVSSASNFSLFPSILHVTKVFPLPPYPHLSATVSVMDVGFCSVSSLGLVGLVAGRVAVLRDFLRLMDCLGSGVMNVRFVWTGLVVVVGLFFQCWSEVGVGGLSICRLFVGVSEA
ncbi:hypothetical protein KSS87_023441 [Heliosperma pusillum]|nr:hypothetical protein KSS87_023441 [Heliosperma pusillum]